MSSELAEDIQLEELDYEVDGIDDSLMPGGGGATSPSNEEALLRTLEGKLSAIIKDMVQAARRSGDLRTTGDMVEPFDPDDRYANVDRWLSMLDQLGEVHGWSQYERSYFMQIKLRGAAREWFNRQEDFSFTWVEWKERLRKAFPRQSDYALLLEELVARRKLPTESMTTYYYAKLALCSQCEIMDMKAVSCTIRGLPEELGGNALGATCATPEALYANYLVGMEGYKTPMAMAKIMRREGVERGGVSTRLNRPGPAGIVATSAPRRHDGSRCFNCQKTGHYSADCGQERLERCRRYFQVGHLRMDCPRQQADNMRGVSSVRDTKMGADRHDTTGRRSVHVRLGKRR